MNTKARITSVLKAENLDTSITGLSTFDLSELLLSEDLEFQLPTNLRLGHLAEKIVSHCIKLSTNYIILHENVQIKKDKNTIGELDFIIQNIDSKELIHLELAYKFYLFDPTISKITVNNWIGPNRNDSLREKLDKLRSKQFPLLRQEVTKAQLPGLHISEVSQKLCLLISLFIPYQYKEELSSVYKNAIKGYYIDFKTLNSFDHSEKMYHIPSKKEWGIAPSENKIWTDFAAVEKDILEMIHEKHAPLCWQKHENAYEQFFIVWW